MNESVVRSYPLVFDDTFAKSKDEFIYTRNGKRYIDFFAGAGSLNYGHNNDRLKAALLNYISNDGITHALDMQTDVKERFLEVFSELVLKKRGYDYVVQFTSPSGTNANEAAIKLAKKVTGRSTIFSFTGAFHGMTVGSLSATGNSYFRDGIPGSTHNTVFMPYEQGFMKNIDSLGYIEAILGDPSSGVDLPAAMIVETIQAEGGVNPASADWLRGLRRICDKFGILMIVDDIQVGCGRSGQFFSFEEAGIVPDIVTLAKSISGYGLPMAINLIKPDFDKWLPGQHSGTFRGNQHAFVTATEALLLREEDAFDQQVSDHAQRVQEKLDKPLAALNGSHIRGRGMIWGCDFSPLGKSAAKQIAKQCFEDGLIIECAGRYDEVLKILPPLNAKAESINEGLDIIVSAAQKVAQQLNGNQPC